MPDETDGLLRQILSEQQLLRSDLEKHAKTLKEVIHLYGEEDIRTARSNTIAGYMLIAAGFAFLAGMVLTLVIGLK